MELDTVRYRPLRPLKALLLCSLALPLAALAHDAPEPRSLTVTGEGEVRVVPDRAQLQLGVHALDLDLRAAEGRVNRVVRDYLAEVKKLGARDSQVSTTGISVHPEYMWDEKERRQVLSGYRVRRDIVVTVADLEKLGEYMLRATRAGVNQINPPALESSRAEELEKQVLVRATEDAKAKARLLADTLGQKLGPALRVNAAAAPPPPVIYKAMAMRSAEAADAGQEMGLSLGEIRLSATVTAEFELLP